MEPELSKRTEEDAIGGAWLAARYAIDPVQPLRYRSRIARRRSFERIGNRWNFTYEERYRPAPSLSGHLEFMLRHERIHLEFLSRLFDAVGGDELSDWARRQPTGRYEDGLTSTFHFDAYADAEPAWRYPDLTDHVEYLAGVVKKTLDGEMRDEARQMRAHRRARQALNELIEGPDQDLDRIVRSLHDNGWTLSNKLRVEFPLLANPTLATQVIAAVRDAFAGE